MTSTTFNFPTEGNVDRGTDSDQIEKIIAERIQIANDPRTIFVAHDDAFVDSQKRLMRKLVGEVDAT